MYFQHSFSLARVMSNRLLYSANYSQLHESIPTQSLSKHVGNHLLCRTELLFHVSFLYLFPKELVLDSNVFGGSWLDRLLTGCLQRSELLLFGCFLNRSTAVASRLLLVPRMPMACSQLPQLRVPHTSVSCFSS